jgi:hypothetical protein
MDKVYETRQDFIVYVTMAEAERPYIKKVNLNRNEYDKFLKQMHVGVGFFKDYSAWSLSVTDGLGHGLPYLLPKKLCYPEMVGNDYPFFYTNEDQFIIKLCNILDDDNFNISNHKILKNLTDSMSWEKTVPKWFNNWNIFNDMSILAEKTEKYKEIH